MPISDCRRAKLFAIWWSQENGNPVVVPYVGRIDVDGLSRALIGPNVVVDHAEVFCPPARASRACLSAFAGHA